MGTEYNIRSLNFIIETHEMGSEQEQHPVPPVSLYIALSPTPVIRMD